MPSTHAHPAASACPRCGRPIPADAPLGACPHCLLAAGLPSALGTPAPEGPPPATPAELAPEFPALEIIELLGRGGMGAVYKARQRDLDRLVALKILRPGLDSDPGFAERFTREARALAQLNHPGIVTLYEFGRSTAGRYFILMEFVDGVNLRGLLDAGRLAPREALAIVPPLCDALQYAHDRGLVHRDIKPENILVDRLGRVKIADFGIARLVADTSVASSSPPAAPDGLTEAGKIAGTPAYMAPEQRERPAEVDHRADLYALGLVLYQMLTGELPADGQLQPPSTRVRLDVRLDAIVLRALEKDPALRYAAASEFKTHLETVTNQPAPADAGAAHAPVPDPRPADFEYKSRRTLFGLPWLHVVHGSDPATGRAPVARGVVAIGGQARGIFAFGGVTAGVFAFGGISFGLFAFGGLGIALLASFSGLAIAPLALGGASVGRYALGGLGFGRSVLSGSRRDPAAVEFFEAWASPLGLYLPWGVGVLTLLVLFLVLRHRPRPRGKLATGAAPAPVFLRAPGLALILLFVAFLGLLPFLMKRLPLRLDLRWDSYSTPAGYGVRPPTPFPAIPAEPTLVEARFSVSPPTELPLRKLLAVAKAAVSLLASCEVRRPASAGDWHAAKAAPRLLMNNVRVDSIFVADEVLVPIPPDPGFIWTRTGQTFTRHSRPSASAIAELTRLLGLSPPEPEHRITLPRARPLAYDFDAEKFVEYSPTPGSPHGISHSPHWHHEQGTDIFADPTSPRPGVRLLGAKLIEVAAAAWEMPLDELTERYRLFDHSDGGSMTFLAAPAIGEDNAAHVYRSPQGALFLLQLLGSTNSGDVELRYRKLARAPIGRVGNSDVAAHLPPTDKRTVLVTDQRSRPPRAFSPDSALPVVEAAVALFQTPHSRLQATDEEWRATEAKPHLRLDRRDADVDLPELVLVPLPPTSGPILSMASSGPTRHSHLPPRSITAIMRSLSPTIPFEPQFRFGAEKEITLPRNEALAYDFDHERFVEYRSELKPSAPPRKGVLASTQWLFEQGGEVFADRLAPSHASFIGTSRSDTKTSISYVPRDSQNISADEACFLASETTGGGDVTVYGISVATACICRTREGRLFFVEVLGVADGGIILRYKAIMPVVPPNPVASAPEQNP